MATKKIIISSIIGIVIVFFFSILTLSLPKKTIITKESTLSSSPSNSVESEEDTKLDMSLPTRADLKKQLGAAYEDLGSCQIITVFYEDKNQAILENKQGIQVKSSLSLNNETELTFTLETIEPPIEGLKVGDSVSLIRVNEKLYAYQ